MKLEDFQDMMQFSVDSINRKNIKDIKVKTIVNLRMTKLKQSICLDVKGVGFDDKAGTIYIEV